MNGKSYDIEFFKTLAIQKGGKCLSIEYVRLAYNLEWQCKEGHVFKLAPQKIFSRNYWCPECTGRRTVNTLESIRKIAQNRGWKFLSPEFTGGYKKYKFQCDKGHEFYILADNVIRGVGCRTCSGKQLLTIDIFKKIASDKGGECLSEKYGGQNVKLEFRCKNGHKFKTVPNIIKNEGTWCKKCAGLETGTIEEMRELAKSKGGECLSEEYINSGTKLKWKCKDNHTWEANPRDVKHKSWCPYCTWYTGERKCKYILERLLNTEFHKTRRILRSGLELDGYSKEYNLAFEYNGEQHYVTNHFFNHSQEKLQQIRRNDKRKSDECESRNIGLIIIPHFEAATDFQLIKFLKEELKGRKIDYNDLEQNILMNDFYLNNSVLIELKTLIESKGGKLLSNEYLNSQTKLKVICENGHIWETNYTQIKLGSWCPTCSGRAKGTIEEMQKIAKERNGKCLSGNYINSTTSLKWECEKGHVWHATPQSVKMAKTWCLKCAGNAKLTIEDMVALAKQRGGKCLSEEYINNSTKLLWECEKGHQWEARPQDIKNKKSWCPKCRS